MGCELQRVRVKSPHILDFEFRVADFAPQRTFRLWIPDLKGGKQKAEITDHHLKGVRNESLYHSMC